MANDVAVKDANLATQNIATRQGTTGEHLQVIVPGYVDGGGLTQTYDLTHPLKVDPTGTTTQPVSGTVANGAGEAHIGEVGGNRLSVIAPLRARPANATAYANLGVMNISLTVTAATNASPSVVTTGTHGLFVGDWVTIAGAVGNTAINGNYQVATTPSGTTFTLVDVSGAAVNGNGVWTSGGTVAQILYWPNLERVHAKGGFITKVKVSIQQTGTASVSTSVRLWLYNTPFIAVVDQVNKSTLWANDAIRIGYVDIPLFSEGSGSDCVFGEFTGSGGLLEFGTLTVPAGDGSTTGAIWGELEFKQAFTPLSGGMAAVTIAVDRN